MTQYLLLTILHYARVNERRYEFGDEDTTSDWVCAKIPNDGRIKKDCIPKVRGRHSRLSY